MIPRSMLTLRRAAAAVFLPLLSGAVYWLLAYHVTPAGRISGIASLLLFSLVVLRFLRRTAVPDGAAVSSVGPNRASLTAVFLSLLTVDAGIILFVGLLRLGIKGETSLREALAFWTCTDSQHYLAIAEDWYLREGSVDRLVQLVFLPGYPLAVRMAHWIIPDYLVAGLIVSVLSFAGAGTVLYRLVLLDFDAETARRALRIVCLLPGSFFFAAPMSESLFLLLSVSCIYLARRGKWLLACAAGGLAAFTRSLGLPLLVPVIWEVFQSTPDRSRRWRALFLTLLIPAGFGAYCLICRAVSGNPFQWMVYQREHWNQQLGLFFHTAAYQTENAIKACRARDYKLMMGLWLPNLICSFSALAVMAASIRRLRPSYGAYFISYYVVAIGATWLLSAPRYLLVLFPLPLGLAVLAGDRRLDALFTMLLTAFCVLYALLFACRWQVW